MNVLSVSVTAFSSLHFSGGHFLIQGKFVLLRSVILPFFLSAVRFLPIFPLARLIQLFWGSRGGTKGAENAADAMFPTPRGFILLAVLLVKCHPLEYTLLALVL